MIVISEINLPVKSTSNEKLDENDYAAYVSSLSDELNDIISSIDGVGDCRVMITLKNTKEKVFAENTEKSDSSGSTSENNEYVIYDSENGDSPILLKENFPAIEGVAVVCSGGDNVLVKEKIINCVCALFNISANRVSVAKSNAKGDNNG
ncbi:MAG: hypothetical protein LIO43_05135 [Clostridiales bacterium]|nr:hypothetical protein [Clostridiales bacterium]